MNCLCDCSYVVPARGPEPEYENPIFHHWQVSQSGYNFYFCASHRAYHCMYIDGNLDQPYCGECAPFYYQGYPNIVWQKDLDRHAELPATRLNNPTIVAYELIMMNLAIRANHEAQGQHRHAPAADAGPIDYRETLADLLRMPSANDLPRPGIAVPRDHFTYEGLGTVLVGSPRQRGLFRLAFRNYAGAVGWMPCGPDIGRRAEFLNLAQHEEFGDPIFKSARLWACKVQGYLYMPKDIRWVLWSIYMLSNEVLYNSQEDDEQVLWLMRVWLNDLYFTAQKLFDRYQLEMPVPMPEHDWLERPIGRFNPPAGAPEQQAMGGQPNTPAVADTGSNSDMSSFVDLAIVDESSGEDTPDEGNSEMNF
ncbi:hypothetical protein M441DRAFT_30952 [Trichoderma asperellum CBS 433.97]|uniref:Uncharacterized protein n=2 Tax=Trichoderma asperellum TaxID=101201 RepID=A0A2T3YUZ8_TRIA4|nr:hypothetical protein M441DRAFT_30952 [Trichoderma asperellum CBS 433.97]PTB36336.1 hypothetical protein M441DRAFT_30952 [Trichoderma asperellum CBS 433.97]